MRYREHRYPCGHQVMVTTAGRAVPGVIVNVSAHGARLAGVQGIKVGYQITLDPGPGCPVRTAEVRWARGDMAGLRFHAPLESRTVALIRRAATAQGPQRRGTWNLELRELR